MSFDNISSRSSHQNGKKYSLAGSAIASPPKQATIFATYSLNTRSDYCCRPSAIHSARWESITRASIYFEAASIRVASYWNTIFTTVLTDVALPLTRYGANRQVRSVCSKPGGTSVKGITSTT